MVLDDYDNRRKIVIYFAAFATLYMLMPIQSLIDCLCCACCTKKYRDRADVWFEDVQSQFTSHYDTSNPMTKNQGIVRILTSIIKRIEQKEILGPCIDSARKQAYKKMLSLSKRRAGVSHDYVKDIRS